MPKTAPQRYGIRPAWAAFVFQMRSAVLSRASIPSFRFALVIRLFYTMLAGSRRQAVPCYLN